LEENLGFEEILGEAKLNPYGEVGNDNAREIPSAFELRETSLANGSSDEAESEHG